MSLHALAAWTAVVLALSALALPLAAWLFPGHPDRGASFAPPLAIGTLTLTGYWVGHFRFGLLAAIAGVLVLGGLSALAWRRGYSPDGFDGFDYRRLAMPTLVFATAAAGMLVVRYLDPAATPVGGEKFLDFGLLAVLQRTDVLPPADMWYAGETVRYYYGGPLAVTLVSDLAGVAPEYAYNLGIATWYGMLATAVYGLAAAIADSHGDRDPRVAGLTAAFLVAVGGRLVTPVRLIAGRLPREFALEHLGWAVAGIRQQPAAAFDALSDLQTWAYWLGRYVVPDALHVYPSWAFLNGDLHAHLLATPFLVLAAATAFAARTGGRHRRLALLVGVLPATAGLLGLISTWSLPTAVGLAGLALALAPTHPLDGDSRLATSFTSRLATALTATRLRAELSRLAVAALAVATVACLAVAWAHPFLLYRRPDAGGIGFMPPGATLAPLLLAHGLFLAVFAWGAVSFWRARATDSSRRRTAVSVAGLLAVTVALVWVATTFDVEAVLVFVPVILLGWAARRMGASDAATLAVAGAGILLVAEFAYAKVWPHDPNAPRWNTIYKISMQAFVLWGTAAGVILARKLAPIRDVVGAAVSSAPVSRRDAAAVVAATFVILAAATFPAMALAEHVGGVAAYSENSLSATTFVENAHADEAPAIDWLQQNVSGTPTIVTAPGSPMYTWVSAPSSLTGLPTVVGWRHEAGYRGQHAYDARTQHVEAIYESRWPSAAVLLDFHDVDYVYVGPVERDRYEIRRFAARPGVDIAYRDGNVTIYEIDADAACNATSVRCPPG